MTILIRVKGWVTDPHENGQKQKFDLGRVFFGPNQKVQKTKYVCIMPINYSRLELSQNFEISTLSPPSNEDEDLLTRGRLRQWSFFSCDAMAMFFSPHDAKSIISGDILSSQSVRLFIQIVATDYLAMFFNFEVSRVFSGFLRVFGGFWCFWWVFEGFWRFSGGFEGFMRCNEGYWVFSRWTSPLLRLFF